VGCQDTRKRATLAVAQSTYFLWMDLFFASSFSHIGGESEEGTRSAKKQIKRHRESVLQSQLGEALRVKYIYVSIPIHILEVLRLIYTSVYMLMCLYIMHMSICRCTSAQAHVHVNLQKKHTYIRSRTDTRLC